MLVDPKHVFRTRLEPPNSTFSQNSKSGSCWLRSFKNRKTSCFIVKSSHDPSLLSAKAGCYDRSEGCPERDISSLHVLWDPGLPCQEILLGVVAVVGVVPAGKYLLKNMRRVSSIRAPGAGNLRRVSSMQAPGAGNIRCFLCTGSVRWKCEHFPTHRKIL